MFNLLSLPSSLQRLTAAVAPAILLGTIALASGAFSETGHADTAHADTNNSSAAKAEKKFTEKLAKQHLVLGETVDSINNYSLDGWNYVDDQHIVINTGPSKHYLITLMTSCHDLSAVENIAFTTTVNRLTKFDKLMVRGVGGMVQHCPITQINALTKNRNDETQ